MIVLTKDIKPYCMREYYKLNRKNWWVEIDGKRIPNKPWQEFWCLLHGRSHEKDKLKRN